MKLETREQTNYIVSEQAASSPTTGASSTGATPKVRARAGHRRVSIRFRLACLVAACVLPVWFAAGFLVYHNCQSRRALTEQRMLETARALTLVVDRELANMQASLEALATSPSLASGNLAAFHGQAQAVVSKYAGGDIILEDATGRQLVNVFRPYGTPLPEQNVPDAVRRVFETGKATITNLFKGALSGQPRIGVDVPVFRDGRVAYALVMSVPADHFAAVLSQQHLPPEWIGRIFDSNQVLVARTRLPEKFVGRQAMSALAQRMRDTTEGSVEVINFENVPLFNSFSRSATSGWTVAIGVPKAIMLAEIWRWLWLTVASTVLLSIIGLGFALLIGRRIAGSIRALIAPALALGRGEPVVIGQLDLTETNEVGESLVKAAQLLQQRAAERERAEAARREAQELKRYNAELQRSEAEAHARAQELAALMDAVPAITFIAHDPECLRMTSSRTAHELLQVPHGANTSSSAPDGERPSSFCMMRDGCKLSPEELPVRVAAATGRKVSDCELTLAFEDGSSRDLFGNAVPLFDESGRVRGSVAAFVDITALKLAESLLRAKACRLEAILDHAPIGINILDRDGRILESNVALHKILGYSAEELSGMSFAQYTHPDDVEKNLQLFHQLDDGTLNSYELEKRYIRKDGKAIWGRLVGSVIDKELRIGLVEDITDRKLAEEQLRATAERLQKILDQAPIGITLSGYDTRLVETNAAYQRITGYSAEELKGMSFLDYTHPDDRLRNAELVDQLNEQRVSSYRHEKRFIRKDGRTIWVRGTSARLNGEYKIGIVEDISEHKEAVEQLRRSETRLRRLIESNIIGIIVRREAGQILEANDAFLQITGYTREDFADGLNWRELTVPEYEAQDEAMIREMRQLGSVRPYEKEYFRKDGSRVPVMIGGVMTEADEAIAFVFDLTERKKAQVELERLARIVESAEDAVISLSLDGTILSWNKGAERLYGYSQQEMIGASDDILIPADCKVEWTAFKEAVGSGKRLERFKTVRITKMGRAKHVGLTISPIRDEIGRVIGISTIARDRTQIVRAEQTEEQLRLAQRLEALGRLAGGVAHDFNNLLMVISSYAQMMQDRLGPEDKLRRHTQQILKATERAASLTQHMLAFSRKQVLAPQVIDVNNIIEETVKMAKRLIGEDIELEFLPGKPLSAIEADPGQITQVLLNLCVNARDAMPKGGRLTIETQDIEVDSQMAAMHPPAFVPGKYVMLAVTDTGVGMTKEIQERIFEPFFTTKALGQGTGLGLAMVYGVVKQSGGYIWVYSELGCGTCFKLYFPRVEKQPVKTTLQRDAGEGQGQTILVLEDEEALRKAVCEHLKEHGFEVLEALNGKHALEIAERHPGPIHVLLTDVIMPEMSGPEISARLKRLENRRDTATLYMSGYTGDAIVNHGVLQPGVLFIQKPFSLIALTHKLREVLRVNS